MLRLRDTLALSLLCTAVAGAWCASARASAPAELVRGADDALTSARAELEPLFRAADKDASALAALLARGSRALTTLAPRQAALLGDTLEPYARRAYFGPERFAGMQELGLGLHTVEKGENPSRIASSLRFAHGLLPYLNKGYDERKLRVGQELKVLDLAHGGLEIEVRKAVYRMFLWRSNGPDAPRTLVACLPIGLGAPQSPTPEGTTRVVKRVLNPSWTHPETKQVLAADDPANVLGGYWIALDAAGLGKSGIGFHGFTGEPPKNWIEQPASHGCVRLLQPDIDRVFQVALEGTPVVIRD